jgi:hypothetical protein
MFFLEYRSSLYKRFQWICDYSQDIEGGDTAVQELCFLVCKSTIGNSIATSTSLGSLKYEASNINHGKPYDLHLRSHHVTIIDSFDVPPKGQSKILVINSMKLYPHEKYVLLNGRDGTHRLDQSNETSG